MKGAARFRRRNLRRRRRRRRNRSRRGRWRKPRKLAGCAELGDGGLHWIRRCRRTSARQPFSGRLGRSRGLRRRGDRRSGDGGSDVCAATPLFGARGRELHVAVGQRTVAGDAAISGGAIVFWAASETGGCAGGAAARRRAAGKALPQPSLQRAGRRRRRLRLRRGRRRRRHGVATTGAGVNACLRRRRVRRDARDSRRGLPRAKSRRPSPGRFHRRGSHRRRPSCHARR